MDATALETPEGTAIRPSGPETKRGLLQNARLGNVVLLIVCLVLLYLFWGRGMRFFLVPSRSMEPQLLVGDYLVTLNQSRYERGDIVVVDDPQAPGEHLVKRIAGVAGDRVEVRDGALFVNGGYVSEPFIKEPMHYTLEPELLVPEGQVFLLGDNRNGSEDGHVDRTTVPADTIVGQVVFIYYPFNRYGRVESMPMTPLPAS